jgi:flagellar biosynthesis/type III secretory pathway chaperone
MHNESYFSILKDTLQKKSSILDELIVLTKQQEAFIMETPFDEEKFDEVITNKQLLIEQINQLDSGFEKIYLHIKVELTEQSSVHREQIRSLQDLVSTVMQKGTIMQSLEKKNKNKMEVYLQSQRKNIKNFKINNKAATNYYKSMSNQYQQGQSYFLDKKK